MQLTPYPEGTEVIYEGQRMRVIQHQKPEDHPNLPPGDYDLKDIYPDGVGYWLHPVDRPFKMDNGAFSKLWVRRTSFLPVRYSKPCDAYLVEGECSCPTKHREGP